MREILERLENLILLVINATTGTKVTIDNFRDELLHLKNFLIQEVYRTEVKSVELLIQSCQATIIDWMDRLNKTCGIPKQTPKIIHLCKTIISQLNQFLSFIEIHYSRYFNLEEKVPDTYCFVMQEEFAEEIKHVKKFMEDRATDPLIIQLAIAPITEFITGKNTVYSYRQTMYLKDLLRELRSFGQFLHEQHTYPAPAELLIYMNFNSVRFINYLSTLILASIEQQAIGDKLTALNYHLKEISQKHTRMGVALHTDHPSVKEQMQHFLNEEIRFLEKQSAGIVSDKLLVPGNQTITVHKGSQLIALSIANICYFYRSGADNYVATFSGERYLVQHSLDEVERKVDASLFFRANRQWIVNRSACKYTEQLSHNKLALFTDPPVKECIIISQKKGYSFRQWLNAS